MILMATTVLGAMQQLGTAIVDPGRKEDIYAVYSALFAGPDPRHPAYLIVAKTSSLQNVPEPFGPKRCVTVPPAYATDWNEILAEFSAHKDSPGTIEALLKIATPYRLLNDSEDRETREWAASGVVRLENVYFNQKRSLALTYRAISCGWLCGTGSWIVLEKSSDGTWQTRPQWVHCLAQA
jgi:hypothetical protein